MSLAAIREVRRLFPKGEVTLLASEWVSGLFEGQDLVDQILTFDPKQGSLRSLRRLVPKLRKFDQAIILPNSFRSVLAPTLARIPRRYGYRRDGRNLLLTGGARERCRQLGKHQIFYYLDLLYQVGLSKEDYLSNDFSPDIGLKATAQARLRAEQRLQQCGALEGRILVAFNPGAVYGSAKRWFADRYARLADRLIEEHAATVVFLGAAAERDLACQVRAQMKEQPYLLSGQTDLEELLGILSRVDLLITNDSGPMHLAAALNVPQIALFGSTDEMATGPWSSRARVIHKHVECSPCLLRECPIDLRCFAGIEVDEVFTTAKSLLCL